MTELLSRNILPKLAEALTESPVILLLGPRQVGKSTLLTMLSKSKKGTQYITFDDASELASAKTDAQDYVLSLGQTVFIDEVQRAPEVFLPIKLSVDRNRQPGRFLLTGSSNVLMLPSLSETLAGRMQVINLWTLSQGEIQDVAEGFVDNIFSATPFGKKIKPEEKGNIIERACAGGFPEPLLATGADSRSRWFGGYLSTVLQREVRDLANIEHLQELPNLLQLLAARACGLLNVANLASESQIAYMTLKRYLAIMQATFLIINVPPWSPRLGKRLTKASKVYLSDTGLLAYLLGTTPMLTAQQPRLLGQMLENFVFSELLKQSSWCKTIVKFCHFRTHTGTEVDILLENSAGKIVGIEVKSSSTVKSQDFQGLRFLQENYPKQFLRGIVLYCGDKVLPFGKELYAAPISSLWQL